MAPGGASSSSAPAAPAAPEPVRMHGEAVAAPAGQLAVALELPEECRRHWENLGTASHMKIDPACRPFADDVSDHNVAAQ
eukprot:5262015-Pyramimonas_sp.AAC.1